MLRLRTAPPPAPISEKDSPGCAAAAAAAANKEWKMLPGGMLVQRRDAGAGAAAAAAPPPPPIPNIRVRVKFGDAKLDVYISSLASFGDLKKQLEGRTGLHPLDQKLLFKGRERSSAAYLDAAGVKDRSKVVVVEDVDARARRLLEVRRSAAAEKSSRDISNVAAEIDKLAEKSSALEAAAAGDRPVAEDDVANLVELFMTQLLKLDGIATAAAADGEIKRQKAMQMRRAQKYVEMLDSIKIKNSPPPMTMKMKTNKKQLQPPATVPAPEVSFDFFDSLFSPAASSATSSTASSTTSSTPTPSMDWELF